MLRKPRTCSHLMDGSSSMSITIVDNCSIHRLQEAAQLFQDAEILLSFQTLHNPGFRPIEETFSYITH